MLPRTNRGRLFLPFLLLTEQSVEANTRAVPAERLVFQKVPAFAGFILDHHLEDFASDQLASFRRLRVPLLKFIETLPEPAVVALSIASSREFLTYLAENRADQQIVDSRNRWLTDQMPTIDRDQIVADDITLITYARKRSLVDFIPRFTADLGEGLALIRELDAYFLKAETSSIDTYIGLLQEKVRQELHFNEKITQTSPGIIYVFDLAERREVYSNDKLKDVLGFSPEELREMGGEVLFQLMHPADLPRALERIGTLSTLADGEIRTWEYRLKDRQGRYRWMRNYESVFKRDPAGRPQQVIGIAIDIDHAKCAGEELERSQEQLLEAQELAGLGSFVWNLTTHEISVTPQVLRILDLAQTGDMKGFMEKVHPEDQEKLQKAIDTALQNQSVYECE
jgi:PAS domain S-box-containing protein